MSVQTADKVEARGLRPREIHSLAQAIGELLLQRQLTLVVAESCTGGVLAAHITRVPGSSAYFLGGVIAYSARVKQQLLGVPEDILQRYTAVSAETAMAMARGVRRLLQADLALATTGIAGPAGATPDQPVGLVYIALASPNRRRDFASAQVEQYQKYLWPGDRRENQEWSAGAALGMLQEFLCSAEEHPTIGVTATEQDAAPTLEANTVEARFDPDGQVTPLTFQWRGQRLTVAQVGRIWRTGQGERAIQHYLVNAAGEALYELAFEPATLTWHVQQRIGRPAWV